MVSFVVEAPFPKTMEQWSYGTIFFLPNQPFVFI